MTRTRSAPLEDERTGLRARGEVRRGHVHADRGLAATGEHGRAPVVDPLAIPRDHSLHIEVVFSRDAAAHDADGTTGHNLPVLGVREVPGSELHIGDRDHLFTCGFD